MENEDFDPDEYQEITDLISQGLFEDAAKKIDIKLAENPDNPGIILDAGYIYANLGKFDKAIDFYQRTIEMVPDSASGYTGLGFVYNMQEQPEKALESFQKGLEKSPDNALIHFEIGETLMEIDRFEEALKSYYKAIQFGGLETEAETLHRIAQVHLGLNDPDKALEVSKNVLNKAPDYLTIHYIMAGAYAMKEDFKNAKLHLEKYLKYNPVDEDAKEMLKHIEEQSK